MGGVSTKRGVSFQSFSPSEREKRSSANKMAYFGKIKNTRNKEQRETPAFVVV
jgi:hypothetical protein